MIRTVLAFAIAGALGATPGLAAELPDEGFRPTARSGAVVGAYYKLPLDAPRDAERAPRTGLRLAMTHDARSPRAFTTRIEANLLDLRLAGADPGALYVAGRPITGREAERLNAAGGGEGGRLDKIMIGAGVALGLVAGFFLVSSIG
jgi:hypothetical protein